MFPDLEGVGRRRRAVRNYELADLFLVIRKTKMRQELITFKAEPRSRRISTRTRMANAMEPKVSQNFRPW